MGSHRRRSVSRPEKRLRRRLRDQSRRLDSAATNSNTLPGGTRNRAYAVLQGSWTSADNQLRRYSDGLGQLTQLKSLSAFLHQLTELTVGLGNLKSLEAYTLQQPLTELARCWPS